LQRQLDKKAEGTAQNISPAFRIYANGFPTPFGATFFFWGPNLFPPFTLAGPSNMHDNNFIVLNGPQQHWPTNSQKKPFLGVVTGH